MNLLKAASTVTLWTLLSRVTGLVRDQIIAAAYGTTAISDAFYIAFRIPNLLRRLFAEGAFSAAFVPVLAATRERDGDGATHALVDAVATVLVWALLLTCVAGIVAAPVVVYVIGGGLRRFDLAVTMTRWMFPYIAFMSLVALSAGVLNTWRRFAVPAATPVMLNVAMIVCAWLLAPRLAAHGIESVHALTAGVLLGGALQLGIQVPALARIGCLPRIGLSWRVVRSAWAHPKVKQILRQMGPALLGVSVAQISLLINSRIATHLGEGAVSWLFNADRLMEFPTALLGVALGVVLVPGLSAAQARGDTDSYSAQLDWGLRLVAALATPFAVALAVFGLPLVAVLFHRGAFDDLSARMTVLALQGYSAGLIALIAIKVLTPGFYAKHDTRTPMRIAIGVLITTQVLNVLLVPWLGHAGLALSIGLAAWLNVAFLLHGLKARGSYVAQPGWAGFALRVLVVNAVLAVVLWQASVRLDWLALRAHEASRVGYLALIMALAILTYLLALRLVGIDLRALLRKRL